MRETRVWSLGWEDPLKKEMATHSSTLAWKIPWMEAPPRLRSMGSQRVRHDWATLVSVSVFLGVSAVKYPPAKQEMWVRSLGWGDPLEKEMVTHSSILAWEIPWTEEPGGLQSMGVTRVGHDLVKQQLLTMVTMLHPQHVLTTFIYSALSISLTSGNH